MNNTKFNPEAKHYLDTALSLDRASREKEAIPLYRKALKAGLCDEDALLTKICLGSSLRNIGNTAQAARILESPSKDSPTAFLFYALSLFDEGRHAELNILLLKKYFNTLLDTGDQDILSFSKPLRRYIKSLRIKDLSSSSPL
ncbi:tetratricopeptide repeat protein [Pseudomonas aeruginosa]|uniref:tetratricopeptide repeat protein n=1 Tax=Pseudomonas aeruginosa TaxID=287 RepID=UPI001364D20A|nr:tetratricopeptide repeat protein [Pseudomonas aeruginosa]QMX81127.1 tetratricopeptide repeat protein [Pseudomonas aeruginosa]UEG12043.1 tetratricopeptide repeat protein [Pseudomonas aeruginosa]HCD9747644.1 tetratricopeptide repeat protein [Pseudomonas aeruginosa]HCE3959546.1 tetratricopeptide repeat protein [Pseudomonas aeruginosa]HCE4264294.1 tetratricopeptide repeat protein [Pseudomonas aeruginosa]